MSEEKKTKVQMRVDSTEMLRAAVSAFIAVMESDGKRPVTMSIGQVGSIAFELGAYDVDRMDVTEDIQAMDIQLDDPVIYEQLDFDFKITGEGNDTIH